MKNKLAVLFLSVGMIGSGFAIAGDPKVKKQDPTVYFWYHFRTAVVNNNFPDFQKLTLFPFETTTPDGTIVKNSKSAFPTLFRTLLDTPGQEGKTMRDIITKKEDLTAEERAGLIGGEIQVASFRFRMAKNKCFFVGAGPMSTLDRPNKSPPPGGPIVTTPLEKEIPHPLVQEPVSEPKVDPLRGSVFRLFWVDFRQAVLDNDVSTVKSLTRFPFETKGPLEEDKRRKFLAKEFDVLWPRLLETDPHSWGPLRDSMKELIGRREEPVVEEIATEPTGKIKVGSFEFQKIKNRWYFTRAIVSE